MGQYFLDQYSLLHFATGVIFYFWGFSAKSTFIIHTLFELFENTSYGMYFINHYIKFWPGGKPFADSFINSLGDTVFTMVGFYVAQYMDHLSIKYNFYKQSLHT